MRHVMPTPRPVVECLWRCARLRSTAFLNTLRANSARSLRQLRFASLTRRVGTGSWNDHLAPQKQDTSKSRYTSPKNWAVSNDLAESEELVDEEVLKQKEYSALPTSILYEKLAFAAAQGSEKRAGDNAKEVERIVRFLVKERQEKSNAKLYSALIQVNVNSETGSAAVVGILLKELREEGIELDSRICHNVLQALAVHPDYLLRNEILEHMRQRWYNLSVDGHHYVTAGLLREGQFELALEKIDALREQQIPVKGWLYDIASYMLAEAGEIDEALRLLKYRISIGDDMLISGTQWYHLLDHASQLLHYDATSYCWKKRVETNYLNPSSGICLNILNTAARHGDASLATDVFRILGNRNTVFEENHYEMLLDTYVAAGNIKAALSVLSFMKAAGVDPDEGSTRSLVQVLTEDRMLPVDQTFDHLRSLKEQDRPVPTAAVNCLIEVAAKTRGLDDAFEKYKALHTICDEGPNTATFNTLFRGCRDQRNKELAMFLASEMVALKVRPDILTYDRLVGVCSLTDNLDDAMAYYAEMTAQGHVLRSGTSLDLMDCCIRHKDSRVWEVWEYRKKHYPHFIRRDSAHLRADASDIPDYTKHILIEAPEEADDGQEDFVTLNVRSITSQELDYSPRDEKEAPKVNAGGNA